MLSFEGLEATLDVTPSITNVVMLLSIYEHNTIQIIKFLM